MTLCPHILLGFGNPRTTGNDSFTATLTSAVSAVASNVSMTLSESMRAAGAKVSVVDQDNGVYTLQLSVNISSTYYLDVRLDEAPPSARLRLIVAPLDQADASRTTAERGVLAGKTSSYLGASSFVILAKGTYLGESNSINHTFSTISLHLKTNQTRFR